MLKLDVLIPAAMEQKPILFLTKAEEHEDLLIILISKLKILS
jgi:hypothetical protein